jgi:hypothetical protein
MAGRGKMLEQLINPQHARKEHLDNTNIINCHVSLFHPVLGVHMFLWYYNGYKFDQD